MTEISQKRVLRIALPVVLSNATVPLLGAVDTAVVGQMGLAAPIGAVGLGAVILASVYWIFGFLRMGTSGLAAQAIGRGDGAERDAILLRGLMVGGLAGLLMVALQYPLIQAAFRIAPASAEVAELARSYLGIRIWGAPATIMLYAITGWLIALERTRAVLALQLVMNGVNIALDFWFVLGLDLGVPGVAIATLIAEIAGLSLGLWLCRSALRPLALRAQVFVAGAWGQMLRVNRDIMIRSVILQGSFTTFLFLGAGMGDVTLAANQVLLQFLEVTAYALDGFAFAAEALVGQAVGARRRADVRRASVITGQWALAGGLALGALYLLAGPWLIDLMTTSPEVREAARLALPWLVVLPLLSAASYIFDGIFIGAMLTREMRNVMIAAVAVYVAALLVLVPAFGSHGLWGALLSLNAARGIGMALMYPRAEAAAA
ncbi:MATE family efflux transporter [Falsigemmobacter intermedius]|uniref:MATE family efflux transporter n=1 Tax=Falsigemmobacter intermedius TaxID=1553448 RepID=A0A444MEK4_9RHOB|nr:MATE family efflux transporter [Falsigemmobacter intermedius]RWY43328.1 MATE family efflux transporter [Falsigemmobacter intermedius]